MSVDAWFWAAVVCYVTLIPVQIALSFPFAVVWFVTDFLSGTALLCVWIEKKWNAWRRMSRL